MINLWRSAELTSTLGANIHASWCRAKSKAPRRGSGCLLQQWQVQLAMLWDAHTPLPSCDAMVPSRAEESRCSAHSAPILSLPSICPERPPCFGSKSGPPPLEQTQDLRAEMEKKWSFTGNKFCARCCAENWRPNGGVGQVWCPEG